MTSISGLYNLNIEMYYILSVLCGNTNRFEHIYSFCRFKKLYLVSHGLLNTNNAQLLQPKGENAYNIVIHNTVSPSGICSRNSLYV